MEILAARLAGARILRAIFKKYAAGLHADIVWPARDASHSSPQPLKGVHLHQSCLSFIEALVDWLEVSWHI